MQWANQILVGDVMEKLALLPDSSIHCVITSPPYFGLRDYGIEGQIGMERSPLSYTERLVSVFREIRRVLHPAGTLWLNLGDSYTNLTRTRYANNEESGKNRRANGSPYGALSSGMRVALKGDKSGLKDKDLMGIPWRVAFSLQDDGWWLRSDIIWCLSGGTWVYARTQKGDAPMMVRDMARLKPESAQLWNGEKWTRVLGWSKSARQGNEIELVLRSGERISCTPTHQFPTQRGLLPASELQVDGVTPMLPNIME